MKVMSPASPCWGTGVRKGAKAGLAPSGTSARMCFAAMNLPDGSRTDSNDWRANPARAPGTYRSAR